MSQRNRLMKNYGWVQNTSNLSTIRDTIDLVPDESIRHLALKEKIKDFRIKNGDLPKRWDWDARCRIKAIHALGLVKLNRYINGYDLTELGRELKKAPKTAEFFNAKRIPSKEEISLFKKGLLTNSPVIRVLYLLENDRKSQNRGLSKYDIGAEIGFVPDIGFTHIDPYYIAANNYKFNDKEGDADKWARTILRWLEQVGWAYSDSYSEIHDQKLKLYKSNPSVEKILRYDARRIVRNVPVEMLCSDHHPFPKLIQKRRSKILFFLESARTITDLTELLKDFSIQCSESDIKLEIINLRNAGFTIEENAGYFKLVDKVELDIPELVVEGEEIIDPIEQSIGNFVVKYENTIPARYIDHIIRFAFDSRENNRFESIITEYFRFIGYLTERLGQGRGRVPDLLAKCLHSKYYSKSYALIIDAKSSSTFYRFPASDKRKMKEYISRFGPYLLKQKIPKHAFSFISSNFSENIEENLSEISAETGIDGCAIDVFQLLELGNKIKQQLLKIEDIYHLYNTNNKIAIDANS